MNKIHNVDALTGLRAMADESVHCIVTSPPYFGLRDYNVDGQIGLESTPDEYIRNLVEVFREGRRVLRDDGTLWLNIGDSYAGYHGNSKAADDEAPSNKPGYIENMRRSTVSSTLQGGKNTQINSKRAHESITTPGLKPKDLIGIPWMLAFALRADGWYLRQDIIWHKPNPMPESVTDRCTKSHEYIFLLSKSGKYYYDQHAIMQDVAPSSIQRLSQDVHGQNGSDRVPGKTNGNMKAVIRKDLPEGQKNLGSFRDTQRESWNGRSFDTGKTGEMKETHGHKRKSGNKSRKPGSARGLPEKGVGPDMISGNVCASVPWEELKANKRSVWTVTTKPFKEAHFATFPEKLITDPIKAGCPENGIVLDPFMGAGTTALVARKLGRNYIGFELNADYIKIAEARLHRELGMFK